MTSEERFTMIEGILAEVAKGQAELTKSQAEFAKGQAELTKSQAEFARGQTQLLESQQGLRTAHMDLEAAQLNTQKSLDRFINETRTRFDDVGEKIANLTILVDRLVARDLERGANGHDG